MEGGTLYEGRASLRPAMRVMGAMAMHLICRRVGVFFTSEDGPTTTEYAVMLALIIVVTIGAITGIGTTVKGIYTNLDSSLPTGSAT